MTVDPLELRVLVLAPTSRDAALSRTVLENAGFECLVCADESHLCDEVGRGAAAVVVTEETLSGDTPLARVLAKQPPWSDLPVLLLMRRSDERLADLPSNLGPGNVTYIDRPVRMSALVSATASAVRARRRQYETRTHIAEREREDRRKTEFLAMLAHELRNPLAPIRTAAHLLGLSAGERAEVRWGQEIIERQVGHLTRLVDDLLDVSRISRGTIELRRERLDLGVVIRTALETSSPLLEATRLDVQVVMPPGPIPIDGDPVRLGQVIANLLNNAAKFTPPSGQVTLTVAPEPDAIEIRVRDTGLGIAPELLPGVFDMFVQGDRSLERSQGGLGIGLTLVRTFVELHGGTVTAASDGPGRGAEFVVRLPAPAPAPAGGSRGTPDRAASPAAASPALRRRVLIVDDNQDGLESLGRLVEIMGNEVRTARDGIEAVEAAARFDPDVILLDIGLPGMNGYEAARRIRARAARPPVMVALTGWGQEEDRARSRAAGFDYHWVKPVDPAMLESMLG